MEIFKKKYLVALDIGTSSIKLLLCKKKEDELYIIKAASKKIPLGHDGLRGEEQVVATLSDLIKGINKKKSQVVISINCPQTAIKKVTLPYMPKNELEDGIRLEARNYFPFPILDSLLDYEIINEFEEAGVRKYQMLVAVTPKAGVDNLLSILKKVGLMPVSCIPVSYALYKLAEASSSRPDGARCLVEIGEKYTEAVVFGRKSPPAAEMEESSLPSSSSSGPGPGESQEYFLLFRKINLAGSDFSKALTNPLVSERGKTEISSEEAEKIKEEIGIPKEEMTEMIGEKISTSQVLSLFRLPLNQLVDEIGRCFEYYLRESQGKRVDLLELYGGGAYLKGLAPFLAEELGMKASVGDPLSGLKIKIRVPKSFNKEEATAFSVAIGLVLSEKKGLNLLPPEIKEYFIRTIRRTFIETVGAAAFLTLTFIYTGMKVELRHLKKKTAIAEKGYASLIPQLKEIAMQNGINTLLADEPFWEDVLKEISNIMPDYIYLKEISMVNRILTINGVILVKEKKKFISDFILVLENSKLFKEIELVKVEESKDKATVEFELTCSLGEKA